MEIEPLCALEACLKVRLIRVLLRVHVRFDNCHFVVVFNGFQQSRLPQKLARDTLQTAPEKIPILGVVSGQIEFATTTKNFDTFELVIG